MSLHENTISEAFETEFADFDDLDDAEDCAEHTARATDIKGCDELLALLREYYGPNGRPDYFWRPGTPIQLVEPAAPRPQGNPVEAMALAARTLGKAHCRVARVVFSEVMQSGRCTLQLKALAARAECSRTSARIAVRELAALGLISVRYFQQGAADRANVITLGSTA